jgi:hypothetical protein
MKSYQKYPDKALVPIMRDIIEALESKNMYLEDMSDVDHNFEELTEIITKELDGYLSNVEFEDITYFIALIIMNDDFEPPLQRPELKTFEITHVFQRIETVNYTYRTEMKSFIPLDESILGELQSSGEYEPWDGNLIDEDNVDSDYSNDWIDNIEEN